MTDDVIFINPGQTKWELGLNMKDTAVYEMSGNCFCGIPRCVTSIFVP